MKNKKTSIHTALIKLDGLRKEVNLEVKELEAMRKGVPDNQRAKLEMRISNRKKWINEINDIELEFREEL